VAGWQEKSFAQEMKQPIIDYNHEDGSILFDALLEVIHLFP
jgi:hypothetical protein